MYACILEIGGGFFEGVRALNDQACISSEPPPHNSWIASCLSCLCLSRFLPLSAVNKHSPRPYLVLGNKLQGEETSHPPLPLGAGYAGSWIWTSENFPSTHLGE